MIDISKKLNQYTRISLQERKKSIKWILKQNEELLLVAFERQKDEYFKLSSINEDNKSILYLSAFYTAANQLYCVLNGKKGKNRKMDILDVEDLTKLQARQFKRSLDIEKWDKLLNLKSKILKLKDTEDLSFRQISEFLHRYHRLNVSHTYISNFYSQMKEEI